MSNFLSSVKADLLDRRLLPIVALVGLALVAALAYAILGGGSSSTATPSATLSRGAATPQGVAISQTTPEKAVAETTGGVSQQRSGAAHNPFTPLPEPKAKSATSAASSKAATSSSTAGSSSGTGSSSSSGGSGTGSSQGSGGSTPTTPSPATPSKPSTPSKPKTVYHVAVLFGALPAGATPQTAQLTPFENIKLLTPLPSAKQPLIIFRGTVAGKSATFTLVSEAILHGPGACLPSTTQCEAIDLREGQAEQLEYLSPTGQSLVYELRIVSIVSGKASSAAIKSIYRGESKAGRELLGYAGLEAIPDLRYSSQPGVLVFAVHRAFAARRRHGR
ncbi:MAG: hypothetical protein JWN10_1253 [Solirubrobacterales bacterium]|nr:hypothetical protein [Solirubrobacterales bacterium]